MPYYEFSCPVCSELNDVSENVCVFCGNPFTQTVNVRRAMIVAEVTALSKRYIDARDRLKAFSLDTEADLLESEIKIKGKAVLNLKFDFLWDWLMHSGRSYQSYRRTVTSNLRDRAKFENDLRRSIVESALFGSHVDIIYAALTIDERSVPSYGPITVVLRTSNIEHRTSALEKNSFFFVRDAEAVGWTTSQPLPPGHMAPWSGFDRLCLVKLQDFLKKSISKAEIADALLSSDGDRAADEFVELYIYGNIIAPGVEKIKIPVSLIKDFDTKAKAQLDELKSKYVVEEY